jgi:hypothetical protein
MKSSGDPPRLRLQAPPDSALSQGLEQAHGRGPTEAQLEALERSVLASLGAAAGAITAAPAAPAATSAGWLSVGAAKIVAALAVATLLSAGTIAAWRLSTRVARQPSAVTPAPVSAPMPARRGPAEEATPMAPASADAIRAAPIVSTSTTTTTTTTTPAAIGAQRRAAQDRIAQHRVAHYRASELDAGRSAPSPAATDDGEELRLLARAHRALAGDPALALTLAAEHERRFPLPSMDQEREIITITALVDLGRTAEARQRAERFAREHPGSAYVGRIQTILGRSAR